MGAREREREKEKGREREDEKEREGGGGRGMRVSTADRAGSSPAARPHGGLRPFHQKSNCLQEIDFRVVFGANFVTSPKYLGVPKPSYLALWNPTTELSPESEANPKLDCICDNVLIK